ncbi:uncharacterized protein LOC110980226 [Acanthaster planci]|uniref:Uncharacterized protein LOC110980226 n=1 Tax=Acanthaster planci TaxID=133434 RepID=A0A8B7YGM5_ACAPL|nr:uncharacterized protein LOC110980226 [Acanthaster planci]
MTLLFNWPRRTPYLNQLDRAQRDSRLRLSCDGRCQAQRPTYAPTIMRSFTAPAAIVAPSALGLCTDRPVAGGLCPVCRSGIVNGNRTSGLLCCKINHSPACPACGVVFDDADDEREQPGSTANDDTNRQRHNQRVKGQRAKAPKEDHKKNKHQHDLLLKPQTVELTSTKKKFSGKKTDK